MLIKGEVEVSERHGTEITRLGFLAEGAFFGEAPVLGHVGEPGVELRMRTVRAVTNLDLIYLTRDDVDILCSQYAELRARMSRFERSGRVLTKKALRKIDMTKGEVAEMAGAFKHKLTVAEAARDENNLQKESFVPSALLPLGATTVVKAANRFKKMGAARRAREEDERADHAASMREALEGKGGLGVLLLEAKESKEQVRSLTAQVASIHEQMAAQFERLNGQFAAQHAGASSGAGPAGRFRLP